MSDNKIKVAGYSQKIDLGNGIEYRPFSPDLVGFQLATANQVPLFTMGNFNITTNMDPKTDKTFITTNFSDFITLSNLNLTVEQNSQVLDTTTQVMLNLDKTQLSNYALFGSLTEFIRVALEDIVIKWPASLYVTSFYLNSDNKSVSLPTFENYTYDEIRDEASFKVNTNLLRNTFSINYLENGTIVNTFNAENDIRNLVVNSQSYAILLNDLEYGVLRFTGATTMLNDYIYFVVKGNVFSGASSTIDYHIKPNKQNENIFFAGLNNFEAYLLNRFSLPKYTATFTFKIKTDSGIILNTNKTVTWPVSDGYNIDFNIGNYVTYVSDLIDIATNSDLYESNLMNRFLVSESITSFDTVPIFLNEEIIDNTGQKINKTLNIYGVSFDEINNFVNGISFANVVSYNKLDNTPDNYVKGLAKVLGWELITSLTNSDLLTNHTNASQSMFSGHSVGLTPNEIDIEFWRRIVINSPWIWKSKGVRSSIEFFLRFISMPLGLIEFNEHVYRADGPIDVDIFIDALKLNNLDVNLDLYPIDGDGYPRIIPNNTNIYYQSKGLWYRETGGTGATMDITSGNNPHVGPYDGGFTFINQFRTLIPNFSSVTIHNETSATTSFNLFTNYNLGEITDYTGATYVDVLNQDNTILSDCVVVTTNVIPDYKPTAQITDCGCIPASSDDILNICVKKIVKPAPAPCSELSKPPVKDINKGYYIFSHNQYNQDGSVYSINGIPVVKDTIFTSRECCKSSKGTSTYTDYLNSSTNVVSSGYACCFANTCGCSIACDWVLNPNTYKYPVSGTNIGEYCEFTTLFGQGTKKVTLPDASNCPSTWTVGVPNIIDPYTGDVGFGCKVTPTGLSDFARLIDFFKKKSEGGYGTYTCCLFTRDIYLKYFPRI